MGDALVGSSLSERQKAAELAALPGEITNQLVHAAEASARAGDCVGVQRIAVRVWTHDPDTYWGAFVHDPILQPCFTAPGATR